MITGEAAKSPNLPQNGNGQPGWPEFTTVPAGSGYILFTTEQNSVVDHMHGPLTASERPPAPATRGLHVPSRAITAESRDILNRAFSLVVDAADDEYGQVERSNCFDDWKEYIVLLSRKASHFTSKHRRLLGALIAATKGKDIWDFNETVIMAFREITNKLRDQTVTKKDVSSCFSRLLELGVSITLPIAAEGVDQERAKKLENMMAHLIEKSRT